MKKQKGSIGIFVLIALLFMSAFLIISFASNVNKSKIVKEQFNIISGIYAYANGEEGAYEKAYTDLRKKNKQTMTASVENSSTLELTKTFREKVSNYRIYGVGSNLPKEYQEVEYIESTGTQYIDTKYIANKDSRIEVKAQLEKTDYKRDGALFGSRISLGDKDFVCWYNNFDYIDIPKIVGVILRQTIIKPLDNDFNAHKINYENKSIYVDGNLVGTFNNNISNSELNLYLLTINNNNRADSRCFLRKIVLCKNIRG